MNERTRHCRGWRLAALGLLLAAAAHAETWRFAAVGDTPYSSYERRELPVMLDDIAAEHPSFIVHVGDFKDSRSVCSDDLFRDRRALFNAARVPFIYVPGDNEWTDCRKVLAGHFDPVERLQKLRELFFSQRYSLGQRTWPVQNQNRNYPEHLLWRLGPVLFISLNVPGPDNNFGSGNRPSREFLDRNPQLIAWLEHGFAQARREKMAGIVIAMQANPAFEHDAPGLTHAGFRPLLDTLRRESLAFAGQVLLIHGDTHRQRIDQPLRHPENRQPVANFTRLETFGFPFLGWVKVIVDDEHPRLFRFEVHPYSRHP